MKVQRSNRKLQWVLSGILLLALAAATPFALADVQDPPGCSPYCSGEIVICSCQTGIGVKRCDYYLSMGCVPNCFPGIYLRTEWFFNAC